ncbi:MAG TPA: hypothetical protein PKE26_15890 [Kiritimatiellia bacterium]|nr:hypothetical protein [Kiritimatiellia bacterium]HMP00578.1 hypothetical protein [Kiritimatiellia bacterium]
MKLLYKMFLVVGCLAPLFTQAQATNLYHTNRVFSPVSIPVISNATAFQVVSMAGQLTQVVGPTNIFINSNTTKAVEYEGFAWGYDSANAAWTSAVSVYPSYSTDHPGMIYDNVGWVKGTREAYGTWGAYLWYLQNHIAFTSSLTNVWISLQGTTNPILRVMVSSLGDYPPMTNVLDVGPTNWAQITNFIGSGVSTDVIFKADLDTYYEIFIADLVVPQRTNSLLTTNVFVAMTYPTNVVPTNYHYEIRRTNSLTWYTLTNSTVPAYTSVVAVAGHFKIRVSAFLTNAVTTSLEKEFTVEFPSYSEIIADTNVLAKMDQAWASTLAATTPTSRREEGFWIKVRTQTRQYEFSQTHYGSNVPPARKATMSLGAKPLDSHLNPTPLDEPMYTVAAFHTHTPTTYRPHDRVVGPSPKDINTHNKIDVVGVVYDYTGYPNPPAYTNYYIPSSNALWGASQLYHCGPDRRSTPP